MKRKWLTYFIVVGATLGSAVFITAAFASSNARAKQWMTTGDMMTEITSLAAPHYAFETASNKMWDAIMFDRDNGWLHTLSALNSYTLSVSQPFTRKEAAALVVAMFGIKLSPKSTPLAFAKQAGWFRTMSAGPYFTIQSAQAFMQNVMNYVLQNKLTPHFSAVGFADLHHASLSTQGGFMAALQSEVGRVLQTPFVPSTWWRGCVVKPTQNVTAQQVAQWIHRFALHTQFPVFLNHLDTDPYLWASQLSLFHATAITDPDHILTAQEAKQIIDNLNSLMKGQLPSASGKFVPMPVRQLLPVKVISQLPELPNGCEVTSLSMLLQFEGIPVTNMTLASEIARAQTPLVEDQGQVVRWGNPNDGFVGHMSRQPGFGVYNGPIAQLMEKYLPNDVLNLTGATKQTILRVLASGRPVEAWTNVYFRPVTDFVTWMSDHGPVRTTFDEHAVVLVGYGKHSVYLDNPLTGEEAERVNAKLFWASWIQMGRQAVTVKQNTQVAVEQEEAH
ncbi:C39 family peptidase [Sulfoacidibacillus thermotolerans]|uniref:Peptidase C39-like domain-containing protein n=1 Tax=Sulfoacidibacillus thermotolerans TaxID=1765684 RepID=A0A2U3DB25_SULT2|nr:C39 family peptidase [Sulfoacidibacillus thermotolerans]PWI58489.1 hypothetical protein BM613_02910 [Sulfoacidibacillus thermotolerans]